MVALPDSSVRRLHAFLRRHRRPLASLALHGRLRLAPGRGGRGRHRSHDGRSHRPPGRDHRRADRLLAVPRRPLRRDPPGPSRARQRSDAHLQSGDAHLLERVLPRGRPGPPPRRRDRPQPGLESTVGRGLRRLPRRPGRRRGHGVLASRRGFRRPVRPLPSRLHERDGEPGGPRERRGRPHGGRPRHELLRLPRRRGARPASGRVLDAEGRAPHRPERAHRDDLPRRGSPPGAPPSRAGRPLPPDPVPGVPRRPGRPAARRADDGDACPPRLGDAGPQRRSHARIRRRDRHLHQLLPRPDPDRRGRLDHAARLDEGGRHAGGVRRLPRVAPPRPCAPDPRRPERAGSRMRHLPSAWLHDRRDRSGRRPDPRERGEERELHDPPRLDRLGPGPNGWTGTSTVGCHGGTRYWTEGVPFRPGCS